MSGTPLLDRMAEVRRAQHRVLERSLPLAKQLEEILELELPELAADAKRLRKSMIAAYAEVRVEQIRRSDP